MARPPMPSSKRQRAWSPQDLAEDTGLETRLSFQIMAGLVGVAVMATLLVVLPVVLFVMAVSQSSIPLFIAWLLALAVIKWIDVTYIARRG